MKKLIEFYKGRVAVYRYLTDGATPKDEIECAKRIARMREKINCYEQFIIELEKLELEVVQ